MKTITLRWSAWLDERDLALPLDEHWSIDRCEVDDTQTGPTLEAALEQPIGCEALSQLAAGATSAAIAVEDITRPAAAGPALERMLASFESAGLSASRVKIIMAIGGHAPLSRHELKLKLGEAVADRCDVWNHNPYEMLVDLGTSQGGLPIKINRMFYEADLKLAIGSVVPHPYAGFGGGGKIVLPGVAGIDTLEMNHRPAVTGLSGAGIGIVETNRARHEMEEIAIAAGLQAVLNIVPGSRRQPLGHFFGHPVTAHREAVNFARRAYAASIVPGADACLLNAYPKDGEMLQVGNAFNAYRACDPPPVREGGTVIVAAACPQGRGHHALHGPGMRLYRDPVERPYLQRRETIIYAPNCSIYDVRKSFWSGYQHAQHWDQVLELLRRRHPEGGRMLVFPTAPLMLPVSVAEAMSR
jgi:nickel-dependent lactate racemase